MLVPMLEKDFEDHREQLAKDVRTLHEKFNAQNILGSTPCIEAVTEPARSSRDDRYAAVEPAAARETDDDQVPLCV
jgi:hypothetical protein